MIKRLYLIVFLLIVEFIHLFSNNFLFAQSPIIQWQRNIGGNLNDLLMFTINTADGGYLLGGNSISNISGDKTENCIGGDDYWIVKTNSLGIIQWQNTIGGQNADRLSSFAQTSDGGYIIAGTSRSNISGDKTEDAFSIGNDDYWVVKLDSIGNVQWDNTIGGNRSDLAISIEQTLDGGYIVGGYSGSDSCADKSENNISISSPNTTWDYWIVKLDPAGNILWENTIGGIGDDKLFSIQQTNDGGYILGGQSNSVISGDKTEDPVGGPMGIDFWVVKLDSFGNIQWQNTIGGNGTDIIYSLQQTSDDGYILGGPSWSLASGDKTESSWGDQDFWVVKIDSVGNIQWQNDIGGTAEDELYEIRQCQDGGYILGGYSKSSLSGDKTANNCSPDMDYWILKLDSTGNIFWQKTIGGTYIDWFHTIKPTIDSGYIACGWSGSNIGCDKTENNIGAEDFWIVKLAPDSVTAIPENILPNLVIFVTPNPTMNFVEIHLPGNYSETQIQLLDLQGNILTDKSIKNTTEIKLDLSELSQGIYIVKVIQQQQSSLIKVAKY